MKWIMPKKNNMKHKYINLELEEGGVCFPGAGGGVTGARGATGRGGAGGWGAPPTGAPGWPWSGGGAPRAAEGGCPLNLEDFLVAPVGAVPG